MNFPFIFGTIWYILYSLHRLMELSEEDGEFYEIGFVRPNSTAEEELEGADGAYETPMEVHACFPFIF